MSCLGARGGALQQANEIQQGETPTADNSDLSSLITENSNLKFGFEMIQTQCQNLQCSSANCSVVPTLCDPTEYSVHGILQARILEWEPLPCPGRSSPPRDWTQVSRTAGGFFTSWVTREAVCDGLLLKGQAASTLFSRTFAFGLLNCHLISSTTI